MRQSASAAIIFALCRTRYFRKCCLFSLRSGCSIRAGELVPSPSCMTLDKLLHVSKPQFLPLQKCPLIPSSHHVDDKNYKTIKTPQSLVQIPVPSGDVKELRFSGCLAHKVCEPTRGPQKPWLPSSLFQMLACFSNQGSF